MTKPGQFPNDAQTEEYLNQPYIKKLRKLGVRPGQAVRVEVRHDDWCPALKGGLCRCDPDVVVRK